MRISALVRRYVRLIGCCVALVPAVGASAQMASEPPGGVLHSGTLSFSAHATVGDFTGTTATVSGAWSGDLSAATQRRRASRSPIACVDGRAGHDIEG